VAFLVVHIIVQYKERGVSSEEVQQSLKHRISLSTDAEMRWEKDSTNFNSTLLHNIMS